MPDPETPTSSLPLLERRISPQQEKRYEPIRSPNVDDGLEFSDMSTSNQLGDSHPMHGISEDPATENCSFQKTTSHERSHSQSQRLASFQNSTSSFPSRNPSSQHYSLRSQVTSASSPTLVAFPHNLHSPRDASDESASLNGDKEKGRGTSIQHNDVTCPAQGVLKISNYLRAWLTFLAFFCALASLAYLILACFNIRWTRVVKNSSHLSTAKFLCSFGAKMIEMSFATSFVTYIGQRLSEKAFSDKYNGLSISDMALRLWVYEPGTILMSPSTVRNSILAPLGVGSFLAMIGCMFYTTASNSLVSPTLQMSKWADQEFLGKVYAQFSDFEYIKREFSDFPGSIGSLVKEGYSFDVFSGNSYYPTTQWIRGWKKENANGNRPPPTSLWQRDTAVEGIWIDPVQQTLASSRKHARMVDNVTLVYPHLGVQQASRDEVNKLIQPTVYDLSGELNVNVSVASPIMNVACAAVSRKEIAPLVYTTWPEGRKNFTPSTFSTDATRFIPQQAAERNRTEVDDIFGWNNDLKPRPVFPTYPPLNSSVIQSYTTDGLRSLEFHIMFAVQNQLVNVNASAPESSTDSGSQTDSFVICQLKAGMTDGCTTSYHAQESGSKLRVSCNENDAGFYSRNDMRWEPNWADMANAWAQSITLGTGIENETASNSQVLSEITPFYDSQKGAIVPSDHPSIAEMLSVEASSTLLLGAIGAPFIRYWRYKPHNLYNSPDIVKFLGKHQETVPVSGNLDHDKQRALTTMLFIPLALVAILGVFVVICGHMLPSFRRRPFITDFTDQKTMFAVAMNSPPNEAISGACASGPSKSQLKSRWKVNHDADNNHYYYTATDLIKKPNPRWSAVSSSYSLLGKLKPRKSHASEV